MESVGTKANALMCPVCCVEYVEVEFDFEVDGVVMRNVKTLQCPVCKDELFSPQQSEEITNRMKDKPEE